MNKNALVFLAVVVITVLVWLLLHSGFVHSDFAANVLTIFCGVLLATSFYAVLNDIIRTN